VAAWFARETPDALPTHVTLGGTKALDMRYGENPHQAAALYLTGEKRPGVARAQLVQGKPLSFNNINDADAAFELASSFDPEGRAGGRDHQTRQPVRRGASGSFGRGLCAGAALRSGLGLWRYRGDEHPLTGAAPAKHHRHFHRGDRRA
jgi:hypothetical protein